MGLTLGGISALALVIALAFMVKKMAKRSTVYLMLIAGLGLGGFLGGIIVSIVTAIMGGAASATDRLFGAGVGGIIVVVIMAIALYPHVKPKGQPPTRLTPWIALAFGTVLVVAGGFFSTAAGLASNVVTQAANLGLSGLVAFVQGF